MKLITKFSILSVIISATAVSLQAQGNEVSHYIFPAFSPGKVLLKAGTSKNVSINYNSITEEMVFEANGTKLALANPEYVDTIYISGRKFITSGPVYYEVLEKLPVPLLVRHLCRLIPPPKEAGYGSTSETSAIKSTSTIFTSGRVYEMKLAEGYKTQPYVEYDLKVKDDFKRIYNANTVIKCFPGKKAAISDFIKKNKIDFKKEEDIRNLIIFCNK
jgi:hypothetical protein